MDFFAKIVIGHLVGDYVLQNAAMMSNKSTAGKKGIMWCTVHCLVYTAIMCLFLWTASLLMIAAIFLSHWPIDRWSLAAKWMKLIKGRDPQIVYTQKEFDAAFYAVVYTATDNTMHILLLWLAANWLLK
jgi:hypothetical protein